MFQCHSPKSSHPLPLPQSPKVCYIHVSPLLSCIQGYHYDLPKFHIYALAYYKHLNAEFQRIARRDKKAFFSDQGKEIEEKNRMGKTTELFKKIRDTKGTFHAKKSSIKNRNGMDLTEAEDIKNRWQEYTEELYKKDLHNQDNHDGMITHLEPDIPECEVKWALESITTNKASGGDGIPVELFQIKDDAVKVLHSIMPSKLGKLSSSHRT